MKTPRREAPDVAPQGLIHDGKLSAHPFVQPSDNTLQGLSLADKGPRGGVARVQSIHAPAIDHRKGEVIGPQSNCPFIVRHWMRFRFMHSRLRRNVTDYAFPQMFLNRPGANAA